MSHSGKMQPITLLILLLFTAVTANHGQTTNPPTPAAAAAATTTYFDDPNEVTYIDFLARDNAQRHRTNRYQTGGRFMVLRRAELFEFNVMMSRPFDEINDKLRLEFIFNNEPPAFVPLVTTQRRANKSQPLELSRLKWDARIIKVEKQLIYVQVSLPPNMPVGAWRLQVSSKVASADPMRTFKIRDTLYVLFNAWSELDDVHMADESMRQEYLMNEVGKIYIGSYAASQGRKWTYGQFDVSVLPTVLRLLDRTRLSASERADVVRTSRAVSAIVNSHDEGGLLVGNWSGNYMDGLSPWQWTGTVPIFRKYIENGYRSVKFGQCWVFGGSTTTTLRTLGIPARTITNFNSAHDTDSSLTVDKFFSDGSEIREVNGDSIWNFHVWSDAWMKRRDLPEGFDGWQAIDATPQEMSEGAYQLGPAPLEAIKQGKTGYAYDVGFVFSEVNADVAHWRPDKQSRLQWRRYRVEEGNMGRKILTKQVGQLDEWSRTRAQDAENIVGQYKYNPGSPESKRAYAEAAKASGVQPLFDGR